MSRLPIVNPTIPSSTPSLIVATRTSRVDPVDPEVHSPEATASTTTTTSFTHTANSNINNGAPSSTIARRATQTFMDIRSSASMEFLRGEPTQKNETPRAEMEKRPRILLHDPQKVRENNEGEKDLPLDTKQEENASEAEDDDAKQSINGATTVLSPVVEVTRDAPPGSTPLHLAAQKGKLHRVQRIVHSRPSTVDRQRTDGATALCVAAFEGHDKVVRYLAAEAGANVELPMFDGTTPLHAAVRSGNISTALILLSRGANFETPMLDGTAPLHTAALSNAKAFARLLISKGANVNATKRNGITPFYAAAYSGNLEMLQFLLTLSGVEITRPTLNGTSPLHAAAYNGHLPVVKLLVEMGMDTTATRDDGSTPLYLASLNGHVRVVQFLYSLPNQDPEHSSLAVYIAAHNGHDAVVKFLLQSGVECDRPSRNGMTPLYAAAFNGHLGAVQMLISFRADQNQSTGNGTAPIHAAAYNGHLAVVKYLVEEAGADMEKVREDGSTALYAAAVSGHVHVVKYLHSKECAVDRPRNDGSSPMFAAAHNGHLNVVRYLCEKTSCDINRPRRGGVTPLHTASICGRLAVVVYLTGFGAADPERGLALAAQYGHLDVVRFYVRRMMTTIPSVDPVPCCLVPPSPSYARNSEKAIKQAIQAARSTAQAEIVDWLESAEGWSPLHFACEANDFGEVQRLLRMGMDPMLPDRRGRTPFALAVAAAAKASTTSNIPDASAVVAPRQEPGEEEGPAHDSADAGSSLTGLEERSDLTVGAEDIPRLHLHENAQQRTLQLMSASVAPWAPESHFLFPPAFRKAVKLMLIMAFFHLPDSCAFTIPPIELWFLIFGHCPRPWAILHEDGFFLHRQSSSDGSTGGDNDDGAGHGDGHGGGGRSSSKWLLRSLLDLTKKRFHLTSSNK